MADDGASIVYTLKDLLAMGRNRMEEINKALDSKADHDDLDRARREIEDLHRRVDLIERELDHQNRMRQMSTEWRRYAVPVLLTIVLIGLTAWQIWGR